MSNEPVKNNHDSGKNNTQQISAKIKETWGKLSDTDIALYSGNREQFFSKLKEQYSLSKEDAEKKIKSLEEACASSGTKAA